MFLDTQVLYICYCSRVTTAFSGEEKNAENIHMTYRNSFLISSDMAHAVHPNYADKHEANYKPRLDDGIIVKENANMKYATTAATAALVIELAKRHDIPLRHFVTRNDFPCGSTIGPYLSSRGLRTLDLGISQLSMHSIREMCGVRSLAIAQSLFSAFYSNEFVDIDNELNIDG